VDCRSDRAVVSAATRAGEGAGAPPVVRADRGSRRVVAPAAKPSVKLTQSYIAIAERQRIATTVALLLCGAAALGGAAPARRRRPILIVASILVIFIAATRRTSSSPAVTPKNASTPSPAIFIDCRGAAGSSGSGPSRFHRMAAMPAENLLRLRWAQVRYARPAGRWGIDTVILAADDGTPRSSGRSGM